MDSHGPICFTKIIGVNDEDSVPPKDSVSLAVDENPRNGSLTTPLGPVAPGGPLGLAMLTSNFWLPGRELKIGFQGGSSWQKDQVKNYAPQWCQHANIRFTFVDSGAVDILIAFDSTKGSWSYLGTDSLAFAPKGKPSMNLGWIDEDHEEAQRRSAILHEFGHALGAVHEHESPYAQIPWNKEVVYRELNRTQGWDRKKVDDNMFTIYTLEKTDASDFDGDSIMLYHFPASWTLNGKGTKSNSELSPHDKAYMKFCYPSETFDAGQFSTMEIRSWEKPQAVDSKQLYYHRKYMSVPQIPVGITSLDANKGANIRIAAEATDATQERFKASLRSWADTTIYSASLTYLEVDPKRFSYLQTGVYNTMETRPWNQPQAKQSKRIEFAKPFADPPRVVTWLQALDMDRNKNWRVKVHATDVDSKGFTIHIDSWADSILYSAGATWLAYPANQPEVTSGRFSTSDIRAWNSPRAENSSTFNFPRAFSKQPKVIMAIDELDYDCQSNLRVRLSTSSVTNTGMTWHLQSWFDSKMYTSGASFFAWA